MEYFLFAGYLFLFAWLVTRLSFFKKSGLNNPQLIILFLLKVMAGIFYGWIGLYYGQFAYMFDTWGFHYLSLEENKWLLRDPAAFITDLFKSGYENKYGGFFASSSSWWNDLKSNLFIKFLAIVNLFSFGNYYINVIFYSFLTYLGPVALYRVFIDVFPGKKIQVLFAAFLIPSFIYWTSGIHKDGIVFLSIAVITYHFYFGLKEKRFGLKRWIPFILSFLIILSLRNYLLVILIPALLAWGLSHRYPSKTALVFITSYLVGFMLFFSIRFLFPALDFPQAVVNRQAAFKKLSGNSGIETRELKPTITGFVVNFPQAITATTLRPHPGDVKHILSLAASAETAFFLLLFLLFLFMRANGVQSKQFIWFCLFFSFTHLLTIGYTVNFLGAIVRYRSVILPFLIIPIVAMIDWNRIYNLLFNNIKNNFNV